MTNLIDTYLESIEVVDANKLLNGKTVITFKIDSYLLEDEFDDRNYHNEKNIINDMLLLSAMKKILNHVHVKERERIASILENTQTRLDL